MRDNLSNMLGMKKFPKQEETEYITIQVDLKDLQYLAGKEKGSFFYSELYRFKDNECNRIDGSMKHRAFKLFNEPHDFGIKRPPHSPIFNKQFRKERREEGLTIYTTEEALDRAFGERGTVLAKRVRENNNVIDMDYNVATEVIRVASKSIPDKEKGIGAYDAHKIFDRKGIEDYSSTFIIKDFELNSFKYHHLSKIVTDKMLPLNQDVIVMNKGKSIELFRLRVTKSERLREKEFISTCELLSHIKTPVNWYNYSIKDIIILY